jgi:ubiquinone/menaquinone biosynthesis C-methylase UbiE
MYSPFARKFSDSRYNKWKCVKDFLKEVGNDEVIIELGSGNGKNLLGLENECIGVDNCKELVEISRSRGINTIEADIMEYETDKKYDVVMCIAVIHHFETKEKRKMLLEKIRRFMKVGGKGLITAWNINEPTKNFSKGDNIVLFEGHPRYYYIYRPGELKEECDGIFERFEYYEERGNEIIRIYN